MAWKRKVRRTEGDPGAPVDASNSTGDDASAERRRGEQIAPAEPAVPVVQAEPIVLAGAPDGDLALPTEGDPALPTNGDPVPPPAHEPAVSAPAADFGQGAQVVELVEGEMRVLEVGLPAGVGLRLLNAPVGPPFNDATLTGLGPGRGSDGPSLLVDGHLIERHRTAAVVHGTSRGPGHADFGEPCQDATGSRMLSDDIVAIMAADGVSAGIHSGEVARHAVDRGLALLADGALATLGDLDVPRWLGALNDELANVVTAIELDHPASTGNATTMALAVVDLVERKAVVVRVGDASSWLFDGSGTLTPVLTSSKEHDDGLVSGKSTALPSSSPTMQAVKVDMATTTAIMVCTDGIGDELVSGRSRYARWLAGFLARPVDPLSFAYAIGMRSRGATDDRGAATCWLPKDRR